MAHRRLWDSSNVPILRFVTNLIHRVEHEREEPHADVLRANLNQAWNALIHILVPYLAEADTAAGITHYSSAYQMSSAVLDGHDLMFASRCCSVATIRAGPALDSAAGSPGRSHDHHPADSHGARVSKPARGTVGATAVDGIAREHLVPDARTRLERLPR